jgi:hypothetical protein
VAVARSRAVVWLSESGSVGVRFGSSVANGPLRERFVRGRGYISSIESRHCSVGYDSFNIVICIID